MFRQGGERSNSPCGGAGRIHGQVHFREKAQIGKKREENPLPINKGHGKSHELKKKKKTKKKPPSKGVTKKKDRSAVHQQKRKVG